MAQEKLLLVLAALIPMFLMANSNAEAGEGLLAEKVTEADRDRLKGLIEESREIVMSTIAEKYRELLMLRQQRDGVGQVSPAKSRVLWGRWCCAWRAWVKGW